MELPRLEPLYQQYKDKGLSIVAVEGILQTDLARKFIDENHLTYTLLETGKDDKNFVRNVFKVHSYPTSFLIDKEGKIIYMHVGFSRGDETTLEKEITRLLAG